MRMGAKALALAMASLAWLAVLGNAQATERPDCDPATATVGTGIGTDYVDGTRYGVGLEALIGPVSVIGSAFGQRPVLSPRTIPDAFPSGLDPCWYIGLPQGCECKDGVIACIGGQIEVGIGIEPGDVDPDAFVSGDAVTVDWVFEPFAWLGQRWVSPPAFVGVLDDTCLDDPCWRMYLLPDCDCSCGVITCGGWAVEEHIRVPDALSAESVIWDVHQSRTTTRTVIWQWFPPWRRDR